MFSYSDMSVPRRSVPLRAQSQAEWARRLRHQITLPDEGHSACDADSGVTVWASEIGLQRAVITWRWIRSQNIVMLEDPLSISTNVRFMSDAGMPLSDSRRVLMLNEIVHDLPWQTLVNAPSRIRPAPARRQQPSVPRVQHAGAHA